MENSFSSNYLVSLTTKCAVLFGKFLKTSFDCFRSQASAGASLHRLLLDRVSDVDCWARHLRPSLLRGLASGDPVAAANACNHWLAPTVK